MSHPLDYVRDIARRLVITGRLVLQTPTNFGNGDVVDITDMPLLLDPVSGRALLSGTSLAGALRAYLTRLADNAAEQGVSDQKKLLHAAGERLFGAARGNDEGGQSSLIVDDALADSIQIELRDGVRIDPARRTAKHQAKYDLQLLEPGTTFLLRLELLLPKDDDLEMRRTLAWALDGLAYGHIRLGLRKQRGFGQCAVEGWSVTEYDLNQRQGLLAWLAQDHDAWLAAPAARHAATATELLAPGTAPVPVQDFSITARFAVASSLLIRSGFGEQDEGPDAVHLHSRSPLDPGRRRPVISGTSLAGALRARARRILRTLTLTTDDPAGRSQIKAVTAHIDRMFGPQEIGAEDHPFASRLRVDESHIEHGVELVQNRIRVDRFTGGAYDSALFNVMPVFGSDQTTVELRLSLRRPRGNGLSYEAEIGLLLLLLKDLWTGRLPLGGESSVGRGRLRGLEAAIQHGDKRWYLQQGNGGALKVEPEHASLGAYVAALHKELHR